MGKRDRGRVDGRPIAGGHPVPRASPDPLKSPAAMKVIADARRRAAAEAAAAARLVPYNRLTDLLGKIWASPLTLGGSLAGAANVAAARLAGDERARISLRDNGIQFESGLFGEKKRAFTLGNAVLHGPGSTADAPNNRYDKQPTAATTAEHESGHTYQYQHPGFITNYIGSFIRQALTGRPNPYEQEADDFAEWKHRQRRRGR
jgi:hypothetical protein